MRGHPGQRVGLIVDGSVADHLPEVVRGTCDVPVARLRRWTPAPAQVRDVVAGIRQAGRQPVLLAARKSELTRYGGSVREVMALRIVQDGHTLTTPPKTTWTVTFQRLDDGAPAMNMPTDELAASTPGTAAAPAPAGGEQEQYPTSRSSCRATTSRGM